MIIYELLDNQSFRKNTQIIHIVCSLPNWAQYVLKYHMDDLNRIVTQEFLIWTETTRMKKIKAGFFIKEVFERIKNKTTSKLHPNRTLWIYSAHDNTIINVLNSLKCFHKVNKIEIQKYPNLLYVI